MTLEEIKAAVDAGKTVHWANQGYEVIRGESGEYLIRCRHNGHCTGLAWSGGLNGKPEDFYVAT